MIHTFHQIQGFKGVAHGAGANKNKADFHGIVFTNFKKIHKFYRIGFSWSNQIRVSIHLFFIGQKILKLSNSVFEFDETMSWTPHKRRYVFMMLIILQSARAKLTLKKSIKTVHHKILLSKHLIYPWDKPNTKHKY